MKKINLKAEFQGRVEDFILDGNIYCLESLGGLKEHKGEFFPAPEMFDIYSLDRKGAKFFILNNFGQKMEVFFSGWNCSHYIFRSEFVGSGDFQ